MNRRVVQRMMNFDLIIKVPGRKNALGDTTYKRTEAKCYIKEELTIIYDALGKEVTSSLQMYLDGDASLKIPGNALLSIGHYKELTDVREGIVLPDKKFIALYEDRAIIKREIFYKPNGIADIGVFYLP